MADTFTPEQITQILEEFFKVVGTRKYIGERYVPIFGRKGEESIQWDNSAPYEPLTIVLYQGNSYTSRQYVPIGVEITNQDFWVITGNYNAQVEAYHRETIAAREIADNAITTANNAREFAENAITSANNAQNDIDTLLPKADFSAENTVKKYIDETATVRDGAITTVKLADGAVTMVKLAQEVQDAIEGGDVTIVSFPSMFYWDDNPLDGKINRSADGIQINFDVSELKPEQGKTYYISPSGNDNNTGETPESPLAKLSTALAKNDVQTVVCANGNYNVYRVAGVFTKGVSIVAAENARPIFVCSYANPWTIVDGQTNVYQCSAGNATCYGVVDVAEKDTYGDYQKYTLVGSIADVAVNAHTYFVDGTTVYANHDTQPSGNLYALIGGVPFHATLSNGETIYIEGCDFIGGNSGAVRVTNAGSVIPNVLMKDCGFTMGYFANSLYLQGCTSIAQNCYASLAKNDGFNYHAESNVVPKAIEIECIGRRNGTSGGNTDNGSTIHDGGVIIRINGEYYGNAGPNIADVGEGTQSYNIGVVTHDSAGESTQNNGIQCQDGIMWNDTCAAYNNTDDYYAFHNGTLRQRNCVGTCKVSGTGRVTSY